MPAIYLVTGSAKFEGGKETTWNVCVYHDRRLAEDHVIAARKWMKEFVVRRHNPPQSSNVECPYDPWMPAGAQRVSWQMVPLELRVDLPTASHPLMEDVG